MDKDEDDTYEDEDDTYEDEDDICVECGNDAFEYCVCGNPLCPMCFETHAGLCSKTSSELHEKLCEEMNKEQENDNKAIN